MRAEFSQGGFGFRRYLHVYVHTLGISTSTVLAGLVIGLVARMRTWGRKAI